HTELSTLSLHDALPIWVRNSGTFSCARPMNSALLFADEVLEFLIDGHECFAFHLVVEVAQVGGAVGVGDDAVAAEPQRVGDPQRSEEHTSELQSPYDLV